MDDVIMMNDPYQEEGVDSDLKTIDIFHHLQLSMKNFANNCKCKTLSSFYCVPCKVTLCSKCNYDVHKKHFLLDKSQFDLSKSSIENLFKTLEDLLNKSSIFHNYDALRNELVNDVDIFANELHEEINKVREKKVKEINLMFENMKSNVTNTQERTLATKNQLINYFEKNKQFFQIKEEPKSQHCTIETNNPNNSIFLLNYDIFSLASKKIKDIIRIEQTMRTDISNFKHIEQEKSRLLLTNLKNTLYETEEKLEQCSQQKMEEEKDKSSNENRIKFTRDQIHQMLNPKNATTEEDEFEKRDSDKPSYHFISMCQKLNQDHFKPINDRLLKFSLEIEKFKKDVMNIINKGGSHKEIEKHIAYFENIKEKGADTLFSKRNTDGKGKEIVAKGKLASHYNGTEQVSLDNSILEKYFSYMMTDLYGKYFKMETKELQSSHADLMIKVNEDEEADFGKVIEGTNEIMIYEKATRKLYKKKVKLTKNPFGYTHFPIGCRTLLIGDKLYITGGKDEVQEYKNVIIYDRKTDNLKRIMDLREARSYHSMVYNEVFETIMVIGGENRASVELFDPLTNRWQVLPQMIHPRANSYFYFDKPRGMFYVMFGIDGSIMNNLYHDSIEYLDLTDIKQGWLKLNYYNKANINLKCYLNVLPLNNELMLIYGGITARNSTKTVCVLNLSKAEISKVDGKLLETLRNESKKNKRLSAIVSTISLNNS